MKTKATNHYDKASRYLAKLDPLGWLRWLLPGLTAVCKFHGWLDTRTIPFPGEPDRICDTVASLREKAASKHWWALVQEFQSQPHEEMFGRLLEYLGRLWREQRPASGRPRRYDVVAVVVNLTGRGDTARDLRLGRTGLRTCLQVAERNLVAESAARTLRGIEAGRITRCVLPLIPLMQGGAEPGIIRQWRPLGEAEPDARRRGDYGGLALVFAELAGRHAAWKEALRGWNVKQSKQVLEWQAEGELKGRAESVLHLLERRTGAAVPSDLAARIRNTKDLATLKRLLDAADEVTSLHEFLNRVGS
jgi:hypothetical protein